MEIPLDEKCTEQLTAKVGSTLSEEIEREARRREDEAGVRVSRGALIRELLVAGLRATRSERDPARAHARSGSDAA